MFYYKVKMASSKLQNNIYLDFTKRETKTEYLCILEKDKEY